jgi:hypothetical protein
MAAACAADGVAAGVFEGAVFKDGGPVVAELTEPADPTGTPVEPFCDLPPSEHPETPAATEAPPSAAMLIRSAVRRSGDPTGRS